MVLTATPGSSSRTPWALATPRWPQGALAYARLARKVGIRSTRLHDTRHTVATTLLVAGVDARTTAGIVGHSSPIVTMSTSAHLLDEAKRDGVDRLGAAIERASASRREGR